MLIGAEHPGALEGAIDAAVAREWGRLAAAVRSRGSRPRRRALDLAIVATANVNRVALLTHNAGDFQVIADLVDVRAPEANQAPSG